MTKSNWTFYSTNGITEELKDPFDTKYKIWEGGDVHTKERTVFGFLSKGEMDVEVNENIFSVKSNMYFAVPPGSVLKGSGKAILCSITKAYTGVFMMGGPIEKKGRLKYIDGCSDSVLISPITIGDPCLNFLYVPKNIDQTAHTHPSVRIGLIVSGNGICRTPEGDETLSEGKVFVLPPDAIHSFHTGDDQLRIVVFHPDSDTGPSHDNHPMLNRSFVDDESAKYIEKIQTKSI